MFYLIFLSEMGHINFTGSKNFNYIDNPKLFRFFKSIANRKYNEKSFIFELNTVFLTAIPLKKFANKNSFGKVGADKVWANLINKYNSIPFVNKVNPDLTGYVTKQALQGVYTMIEVEEKGIREKAGLRNTALLKQVFALKDKI